MVHVRRLGHCRTLCIALALELCLFAAVAIAWHSEGHRLAVFTAVRVLPEEVPEFFRTAPNAVASGANDPDIFKSADTPELSAEEDPEHYLDLERLQGEPLPADRYRYLQLLQEMRLQPRDVGLAPYAITEWAQRLTMCFAEHRKFPQDRNIQRRCLVYAGVLGHYTADICQPLHATIHHNGRTLPDGTVESRGIHTQMDALLERFDLKPVESAEGIQAVAFPALLPAVLAEIDKSNALVDRVYELAPKLPRQKVTDGVDEEVRRFAVDRFRASVQFTANVYLTAWRDSAKVQLPSWVTPASDAN